MHSRPPQNRRQSRGHLRQRHHDHPRRQHPGEELMAKIKVLSSEITVRSQGREDFISLTDMARYKDPVRTDYIIQNWLRNRNTIEFLGIWEQLNNPAFNPIEFDGFRKQAGL